MLNLRVPATSNGSHAARRRVMLAGVPATLASTHSEFMDYATVHLAPLDSVRHDEPVVEATLDWYESPPPSDRLATYPKLAKMERIDRDLYRGTHELAWFRIDDLPSLYLRFAWDGQRLRVHGDFFMNLSRSPGRDWLKRGFYRRRLPQLRRRRFTTLLYYLVYYPCFWWLERQRDVHPIHAGGVQCGDDVVVFAGPSGVGKSTLVAGLGSVPGTRILSDTFLLHHGARMYAVPEPLLLDAWSRRWLGDAGVTLKKLGHRYCLTRDGFQWNDERHSDGGTARVLLFPQRSPSHFIRPLSPIHARSRLSASDLIVNDLRRYWAYASVLQLLDPSPLVHARETQLAALADAVPAYEVGITPEVTRDSVSEEIASMLAASPGAVFNVVPSFGTAS